MLLLLLLMNDERGQWWHREREGGLGVRGEAMVGERGRREEREGKEGNGKPSTLS